MTVVFTIKKDALKNLNAEEATLLFRGLLWCEARRVGLSPHNVVISLDTNVADGGIDARVRGKIKADSILVKGTTHYQLKAGHQFKPWQLSALKKELFGKSTAKPNKKILAPEIRDCSNGKSVCPNHLRIRPHACPALRSKKAPDKVTPSLWVSNTER